MHCWSDGAIHRFDSPTAIVREFVRLRLPLYGARLEHRKQVARAKLAERSTRIHFLELVLSGSADVLKNVEATIRNGKRFSLCRRL